MAYWVIEDSAVLAAQLCRLLEQHGASASCLPPECDLAQVQASDEAVFLSLHLRGGNAFRLLRALQARGCRNLVAISGSGRKAEGYWAERAGAAVVLCRPLDSTVLADCLKQLHSRRALHA